MKRGDGNIPSDVMLLFARRMRPEDIFALSFTSKMNYQLVASVSLIWKRARLLYLPARILPPPKTMTEKEYAWFLTSNRCTICTKALNTDWARIVRFCDECPRPMYGSAVLLDRREVYDREKEDQHEKALYMNRVRELGKERVCGSGYWDIAILAKIPCYLRILQGHTIVSNEFSFELLKSQVSDGLLFS
jgi:hypothetical protein